MKILISIVFMVVCGIIAIGCAKHRQDVPIVPAAHFDSLRAQDAGGQASKRVFNGTSVGDGLAFWSSVNGAPNGMNVSVKLTVYFGPFGDDDNTWQSGQRPHLFRNYINGAEVGRGGPDYDPLPFSEVAGTNGRLWEVTINTFPTNGSFLAGITRDGNSLLNPNLNKYLNGVQNDSTFYAPTGSLQAFYIPATNTIGLRPAP